MKLFQLAGEGVGVGGRELRFAKAADGVENLQRPAALRGFDFTRPFDVAGVALDTKRYLPKMPVVNQGAMLQHIPAD